MGDFRCVEEIDPLLQRHLAPLVEIVDLQDEVLGIEVADGVHLEPLLLERGERQQLAVVYAAKLGLAVIDDVRAPAKVEVDDVHTVDLADVLIVLSAVDVFCDEFRGSEEHSLEVGQFRLVLHLNEVQLALVVLGENIYAVLLVVLVLLVALALKELLNLYRLAEQGGEESLEDSKVGFVAEQALHRPIESDILWLFVHNFIFCK